MAEGSVGVRRRLRLRRRHPKRPPEATMTVVEHLSELRSRLFKCAVAFLVVSAVAFTFYDSIFDFVRDPFCDLPERLRSQRGCKLSFLEVFGGFNFRLKLTALVGLAVSAPIWLYQLYMFILPGLTPRERRYSLPFLASALFLFGLGAAFAYYSLQRAFEFLLTIGGADLRQNITADRYLNFVGLMVIGFGATFQLPLLLIFLGLADVISVEALRKNRRVAIVAIFALAAIVTPSQDPFTMCLLAVPLYAMYEVTIVVVSVLLKRRAGREQEASA